MLSIASRRGCLLNALASVQRMRVCSILESSRFWLTSSSIEGHATIEGVLAFKEFIEAAFSHQRIHKMHSAQLLSGRT